MTKSKQNNSTNQPIKNYIIAMVGDVKIVGELKQSLDGPEAEMMKNSGLTLIGPYWMSALSGGSFFKVDEDLFIHTRQVLSYHTKEDLIAESFDFFL